VPCWINSLYLTQKNLISEHCFHKFHSSKRKDYDHLGCDNIQCGEDTNVSVESAASVFRLEETIKSQKTTTLLMSTNITLR
jgi:hypothetical protein